MIRASESIQCREEPSRTTLDRVKEQKAGVVAHLNACLACTKSWVQYSGPANSGACLQSQYLGDGGRRLRKFKVILGYLVSSKSYELEEGPYQQKDTGCRDTLIRRECLGARCSLEMQENGRGA